MELKRGVDKAVEAMVGELCKLSKAVDATEQVAQVATISANGDTEIGKLTLNKMAMAAANTICKGRGINAQKKPTANAPDTERRLKCQRLPSCNSVPNTCKCLCSLIFL